MPDCRRGQSGDDGIGVDGGVLKAVENGADGVGPRRCVHEAGGGEDARGDGDEGGRTLHPRIRVGARDEAEGELHGRSDGDGLAGNGLCQ
jgi:hypothetical protein